MGLLQKALETYECYHNHASQHREGEDMMAPVGHIVTRANIEITLDSDGNFVNASAVSKTEPKIIIPVAEGSAGRTSAPCAHPLCEQLGYLIPDNAEKYALYVKQLSQWASSEHTHPKLLPILQYVMQQTIVQDLQKCDLVKLNDRGKPEDEKLLIRWRVLGGEIEACWLDSSLFDAFTAYYKASIATPSQLCMVSGEIVAPAVQHPKGIVSIAGNAKLISANDSNGFTYRGRFEQDWQAACVGYEVSQKSHSALRWLVSTQGVILGGRTFLCWNPQGRTITQAHLPFMRPPKPVFHPSEYRDALHQTLNSKKAELDITHGVVLAVFDAATSGRLSLTYYSELQGHDFLQRLHDWDVSCCWPHWKFGIQSPSLRQIVDCSCGTQRTEKGGSRLETDERILCQQMQRLVVCRVDRSPLGKDVVQALVARASQPQAYDHFVYEDILFTACAVIRKYRKDYYKEEWSMALEPEKKDRSYQFGRLLAVMEKVERDTYDSSEGREPNAIRMQSVFCQRPMYVAGNLEKQLERAYFPRLKAGSRIWYKNLMGQIIEVISAFPQEEWNKPLEDSYLMGYYLQRTTLYTKNTNNETEEE